MAGGMFGVKPNMDAVWVVILLTDGEANATCMDHAGNVLDCSRADEIDAHYATSHHPLIDFCPEFHDADTPNCQDDQSVAYVRHTSPLDPLYDADDYARDAADFVGCHSTTPAAACHGLKGQGALIYTIGLGRNVLVRDEKHSRPYADQLLRYIAAVGEDHDPATDPCAILHPSVPSQPAADDPMTASLSYHCGNYYFVATGSELGDIFHQIASNIYTRIQK